MDREKTLQSSFLRRLLIFLLSFVAVTSTLTPVYAQTAANQLCAAAGYGAGCIGAFTPHGIQQPSVGLNPGGLLGGILISVMTSLVIDSVASEATNPVLQRNGNVSADRISALQQSVNQQQLLFEERQRQLITSMIDAPANRIIDTPDDMSLLESKSVESGRVFDQGVSVDPDSLWTSSHDAWFTMGSSDGSSSVTQTFLASEQPLNYSQKNFQPIKCAGPMGLCAFDQPPSPVIKLETVALGQPQPLPAPPPISPLPPPAPPPADSNVVDPRGLNNDVPNLLRGRSVGNLRGTLEQHVKDLNQTCQDLNRDYQRWQQIYEKNIKTLINPALAEQKLYRSIGSNWWKEYVGIAESFYNKGVDEYIKHLNLEGDDASVAYVAQFFRETRKFPGELSELLNAGGDLGKSEDEKVYAKAMEDKYAKSLSVLKT